MRSGRTDGPLYVCLALTLLLASLLLAGLLLAACGPASPTEPPLAATSTLAPTGESHTAPAPTAPPPTATAAPRPTATPTAASPPDTAALKATVIAGLPPTPTPPAGEEPLWGDVEILPLDSGGGQPLWAAFTVGMGFYDWEHGHPSPSTPTATGTGTLLGRVALDRLRRLCKPGIAPPGVCRTQPHPGSAGELHRRPRRLLRPVQLRRPDAAPRGLPLQFQPRCGQPVRPGRRRPPGGDPQLDRELCLLLRLGMRLPMFDVLRWDGEEFARSTSPSFPDTAPAELQALNNRAVALARAMLGKTPGRPSTSP